MKSIIRGEGNSFTPGIKIFLSISLAEKATKDFSSISYSPNCINSDFLITNRSSLSFFFATKGPFIVLLSSVIKKQLLSPT